MPPRSLWQPYNFEFVRVLTPDPGRSYRTVFALYANRPGDPARFCHFDVELSGRGGGSGGCWPHSRGFGFGLWPFNFSGSSGGPGAFDTIHGWASDDVARLEILFADGTQMDVPLTDNAFIVDYPRSRLPARMVAYDSEGRVISSSMTLGDIAAEPAPARGQAELLWRVTGPNGTYFELSVGPSNQGGECQFLKDFVADRTTGIGTYCTGAPQATDPPVQVLLVAALPKLVGARVRDDVKTVRLRFADGQTVLLEPRRGYVLYAVPGDRMTAARAPTKAEGLDTSGRVIGQATFLRPQGG